MKKCSTRHHFLPICYLKGFTVLDKKNSELFCVDLKDQKTFPAIPKGVAVEGHFNTIRSTECPPDALEDALARFEGEAAKAIDDLKRNHVFEGLNKTYALNLIALLAVRIPSKRRNWDYILSYMGNMMLEFAAAQPIGTKVNGVEITQGFKDAMAKKDDLQISVRDKPFEAEFKTVDFLIPMLLERKWSLVSAPDDLEFITCDNPVALLWKNPPKNKRSPGFGLCETQVFFTLSKKIALIGDFDGKNEKIIATKEIVSGINSNILLSADRFIYTPKQTFWFNDSNGEPVFKTLFE
jgi:hypothetical protein